MGTLLRLKSGMEFSPSVLYSDTFLLKGGAHSVLIEKEDIKELYEYVFGTKSTATGTAAELPAGAAVSDDWGDSAHPSED